MSEQAEKIVQFKAITGENDDRAKFYLDSAAGQLEVAIARYYENDGDDAEPEVVEHPPSEDASKTTETASSKVNKPKPKTRATNFATLNTLTASSDEEEEGQAYYAGGSEHSGQQVLGPPKKRDIVADMFKSVEEHGVEILEPGMSSSSRAFQGTGYKLGQDTDDSEVIPGAVDPPTPTQATLKLWQNGFSVDDGDLRAYTDPGNKEFLDAVRRGAIPQELIRGNSVIHLAMEDHRMETYRTSDRRKPVKAFQGQGHTLGSPAPSVVGSCKEEDKPDNESKAKESVKVDNSKPVTSLQIRLADGSRIVGQFNHEHTIANVRSYIEAARPQYQSQPFDLLSSYPSKILEDSQTLQSAGLLNAAIMQKLI